MFLQGRIIDHMIDDKSPKFLKPRLRLFLSADLVGSTALKQGSFAQKTAGTGPERWFVPLLQFYQSIGALFSANYALLKQSKDSHLLCLDNPPEIWKSNGDELIYVVEITKEYQIPCLLDCWVRTICSYRKAIRDSKSWKGDVKASAWLAGFPLANREVIFSRSTESASTTDIGELEFENYKLLEEWYQAGGSTANMYRDFIGPQMDAGFRLGSLATPRKFIISMETAFFLGSYSKLAAYDCHLPIYFDGAQPLKGVLNGVPYPIFWIDTMASNDLMQSEDLIAGRKAVDPDKVYGYCCHFFENDSDNLFRPFLVSAQHPDYRQKPADYEQRIIDIANNYLKKKETLRDQRQAMSGEEPQDAETNLKRSQDGETAEEFIDELRKRHLDR